MQNVKPLDFFKMVKDGAERRLKLLEKKGHDYSKSDIDQLSVFKKAATIANALEVDGCTTHTGSGMATYQFIIKQVRDANLKQSGKVPLNESREDTIDDMHNYIDLKTANEIDEALQSEEPVRKM
jgi:hypothetical protein